jgi:hypothetical protein
MDIIKDLEYLQRISGRNIVVTCEQDSHVDYFTVLHEKVKII